MELSWNGGTHFNHPVQCYVQFINHPAMGAPPWRAGNPPISAPFLGSYVPYGIIPAWHVAWRTLPAAPLPRSRRGWRVHRTPRCSRASPEPPRMGHVPVGFPSIFCYIKPNHQVEITKLRWCLTKKGYKDWKGEDDVHQWLNEATLWGVFKNGWCAVWPEKDRTTHTSQYNQK